MNSSFQSASPLSSTFRRNKAQARGFSLLEVAIALVIFVFGALAIVRIFPGALRVITVGGNRQNALNLNRAAMARVQLNPPAATYDVGPMGAGWVDGYSGDNTVTPNIPASARAVLGSTNRGYSLPRSSNLQDYDVSALGSIRAVAGESATVLQMNDTNRTLFVMTQFPISVDSNFVVQDDKDMDGVTVDNQGNLDFSNARYASSQAPVPTSSANPNRPLITYSGPPVYSRRGVFYVTYKYNIGTQVWGVNDDPISEPGDDDPSEAMNNRWSYLPYLNKSGKVSAPLALTGASVIAGLVKVHQRYSVTNGTFGDTGANVNDDAARGLIGLGSATATNAPKIIGEDGITLRPLQAGDKVSIDYVADWGRVLQEGVPDIVPEATPTPAPAATPPPTGNSPFQMALAAPFLDNRSNDAVFSLLYKKSNGSYMLTPGAWGEYGLKATSQGLQLPTEGDTRASRVTFNMSGQEGATARVSYRTRDQWSQQLSVAAASYKPFNFNGLSPNQSEPWRSYFFNYNNASNNIIYFHGSEAGKSVMVTYSYQRLNTPVVTLRNRLLTIDDQPLLLLANQRPEGFSYVAQLQLTDENGDDLTGVPTSISGVRGASVSVRTAWLDGSRYTQSFLTAMRAGTGAEAMP